jgi:curved DNA-binding protein CbpA
MSSSVSGKFQDHYIALGIESNADTETILAAYTRYARKYSPDNLDTGDPKMFEAISMAYEVLSDPALRLTFDKLKGIDRDAGNPVFSGAGFFHSLIRGALLRSTVLSILCDRRRLKPFTPNMSMRDLESMLQVTSDELSFAMWYLKQRVYVVNDDKSNLQITVDGMDCLERNPPTAESILPLIKPESIASVAPAPSATPTPSPTAVQQPQPSPPAATIQPHQESSVLKALQRALTRDHLAQDVRAVAPRPKV